MKLFFLFIVLWITVFFSGAGAAIVPVTDRSRNQGVEYVSKSGVEIMKCGKNAPCRIVWDADIPEEGNYWILVGYSGYFTEKRGGTSPFNMQWSAGKSTFKGIFNYEAGKGILKRFLGKLKLEKGKQSITLNFNTKDGLEIAEIKLIKDPLVSFGPVDGKVELPVADAYFEGCTMNELGDLYTERVENADITWNLDIPQGKHYSLSLVYGTWRSETGLYLDVYIGTQKLQVKLPPTKNFADYQESQMVFLYFPAGRYPVHIKKTEGWASVRKAVLSYSEEQERAFETLQKKNRLGLCLKELEVLYGKGNRTDYIIEGKGGREDADGKIYQGIQTQIESYSWSRPGCVITAVFYKDKCVIFNVKPEKPSLDGVREMASALLPESVIDWKRGNVCYSRDRKYKIQHSKESFDILAPALLRELRAGEPAGKAKEKGLVPLKAGDMLLGASLPQLQQLWGSGTKEEIDWKRSDIGEKHSDADEDWLLFLKIKPEASLHVWNFPNKNNLKMKGVFWKGRCVAFHMWIQDQFTPELIMEKVKEVAPGVSFRRSAQYEDSYFSLYSSKPKNEYQLQKWGDYIDIKSPGLVRKIMKEEEELLNKMVLAFIKKLQSAGSPVYGKTLEELERLLGDSGKSQMNGKSFAIWTFPNSGMEFKCVYDAVDGKNLCSQFIITDRNRSLGSAAALAAARQIIAPYSVRSMLKDELSSWFTIISMDKDKRFLLRWYQDEQTGPTLCITDQLVEGIVQKNRDSNMKKNL